MAGINFENEQEHYSKPLKPNKCYAAVGVTFMDKVREDFKEWALDLGYVEMPNKMYKNGCNWITETKLKYRYLIESKP